MTTAASEPARRVPARPPAGAVGEVTVGPYTLLTKLGEGGMGVVHLARRPGGQRVALKVLRQHIVGDHEARARLEREVGSLSRVRSRWVAEVIDADPWADVPYVATRYVPGLSLHDEVAAEGPVRGSDLVWLATCLADALGAVHAAGVLHRDVKPSNVLMEGRTPILIDFGLARVADDPKLTHTGWLIGTPGYLAPEILYGDDATAASDVHSWAATIAYAAAGRPPFGRGPSMAVMDRVRRGEHDLRDMPEWLQPLLAAALQPDPAHRPTLPTIAAWLRTQTGTGSHPLRPAPKPEPPDPFTLPLALAAQAGQPAPAPLSPVTPMTPLTRREQRTLVDRTPSAQQTRVVEESWTPAEPGRAGVAERIRRAVLLAAGAVTVAAAVAAYPWIAVGLVLVLVWLLRSGSLAASAVRDRRQLRGRAWYDAPLLLVRTPWDLVRSLPATILLALWSVGLTVAAALLCYAVAAGMGVTLFASGLVLAASLWAGPGGSRVRSPLARVVEPMSRTVESWLVGLVVVLALAALLGFLVSTHGVAWVPGHRSPVSSLLPLTDLF